MMLALSSPESRCCAEGESELIRETMAAAKDMTNSVSGRGAELGEWRTSGEEK